MTPGTSHSPLRSPSRPVSGGPAVDRSLRRFFANIAQVSLTRPAQALFFAQTVLRQIKAARVARASYAKA